MCRSLTLEATEAAVVLVTVPITPQIPIKLPTVTEYEVISLNTWNRNLWPMITVASIPCGRVMFGPFNLDRRLPRAFDPRVLARPRMSLVGPRFASFVSCVSLTGIELTKDNCLVSLFSVCALDFRTVQLMIRLSVETFRSYVRPGRVEYYHRVELAELTSKWAHLLTDNVLASPHGAPLPSGGKDLWEVLSSEFDYC